MESPVVVHVAATLADALVLRGFLRSEGLHADVPGAELADEFGVARKVRGSLEVIVPAAEKERALDVVAAWEERGDSDGEAPA